MLHVSDARQHAPEEIRLRGGRGGGGVARTRDTCIMCVSDVYSCALSRVSEGCVSEMIIHMYYHVSRHVSRRNTFSHLGAKLEW